MIKQRNMTSVFLCCENNILLLYRQGSKVVNNVWIGSAGGHFEPEELNDASACVLRELKEELGIVREQLADIKLRYIVMRHVNGEVRINYFFFANLPGGLDMDLTSEEGRLQWFSQEEIQGLEMALSAKYALEHYIAEGQFTQTLYGGIANGEKVVFAEMPEW